MTNQDRTEVDMGYVQGFVNLIAQALVAATELPKQIEAMQSDLTILHGDLDRTKQRNIELDTLTSDLRRQRDEAEQALSQIKAELGRSEALKEGFEHDFKSAQGQIERLNNELAQVRKERDDYGLKHMATEDRASEAEAKLDKLREAMGMPKEVPKAEPMPTPNASQADPIPVDPPQPRKVYEGDFGFNDLSINTEMWDYDTKRYYRIA